jgi:hypothetical protein
MGYFTFTKRLVCPACRQVFTITSAASKFCQDRACKNKRRRDDRAEMKARAGAYAPSAGSEAHLARALKSGA